MLELLAPLLPVIVKYGGLEALALAILGWRIYKLECTLDGYAPVVVALARHVEGIDEVKVADHFRSYTSTKSFTRRSGDDDDDAGGPARPRRGGGDD